MPTGVERLFHSLNTAPQVGAVAPQPPENVAEDLHWLWQVLPNHVLRQLANEDLIELRNSLFQLAVSRIMDLAKIHLHCSAEQEVWIIEILTVEGEQQPKGQWLLRSLEDQLLYFACNRFLAGGK